MKPTLRNFLRTFAAAHRAHWPLLRLRRSAAAEQCLRIFQAYGLVAAFGPEAPRRPGGGGTGGAGGAGGAKAAAAAGGRLRVELRRWPGGSGGGGGPRYRLQRRSPCGGSSQGAPRLRPAEGSSRGRYLSHRQLRQLYGGGSAVALLQTPRGVLSSREALRLQLGGWLLATIEL